MRVICGIVVETDGLRRKKWKKIAEMKIDREGNYTWNEHIRVSSTLIIAPALSNSPQ